MYDRRTTNLRRIAENVWKRMKTYSSGKSIRSGVSGIIQTYVRVKTPLRARPYADVTSRFMNTELSALEEYLES